MLIGSINKFIYLKTYSVFKKVLNIAIAKG